MRTACDRVTLWSVWSAPALPACASLPREGRSLPIQSPIQALPIQSPTQALPLHSMGSSGVPLPFPHVLSRAFLVGGLAACSSFPPGSALAPAPSASADTRTQTEGLRAHCRVLASRRRDASPYLLHQSSLIGCKHLPKCSLLAMRGDRGPSRSVLGVSISEN